MYTDMNISNGNGILLKLPYADGGTANKERTFIVIDSNGDSIDMLNVSSAKGKEHKLAFPSNELLKLYKPPFCRPSFVKLDAIYRVEIFQDLKYCLLFNGKSLNTIEFNRIARLFNTYKSKNEVLTAQFVAEEVINYNSEGITQRLVAYQKV